MTQHNIKKIVNLPQCRPKEEYAKTFCKFIAYNIQDRTIAEVEHAKFLCLMSLMDLSTCLLLNKRCTSHDLGIFYCGEIVLSVCTRVFLGIMFTFLYSFIDIFF